VKRLNVFHVIRTKICQKIFRNVFVSEILLSRVMSGQAIKTFASSEHFLSFIYINSENKHKTVISKFHIRLLKHLNPNPNPKFFTLMFRCTNRITWMTGSRRFLEIMRYKQITSHLMSCIFCVRFQNCYKVSMYNFLSSRGRPVAFANILTFNVCIRFLIL